MRERIAGFGNFVTIGGKDEKLPAEMEGCLGFWLWDPKRERRFCRSFEDILVEAEVRSVPCSPRLSKARHCGV